MPANNSNRSLFAKAFPWLMILLVLVIAGLAYYFLFAPGVARLNSGGDLDPAIKETDRQTAQNYLAEVKKLQENFQNLQLDQLNAMQFALPNEIDVPGLYVQLNTIANQAGLQLKGVEITAVDDTATLPTIAPAGTALGGVTPASVSAKLPLSVKKVNIAVRLGLTDYASWKQFLQEVESNLRPLDVIAYTFDPKTNEQRLTLNAYYYQQ